MTNAVSLTDGTTTISLSSSSCFITSYNPTGPKWENGDPQLVTESVDFVIKDSSTAAVRTKLRAIENLLYQVQNRAVTRTGRRVYLLFQATDDAEAWRSEILNYSIVTGEDTAFSFSQFLLEMRLVVTRLPYWEGARTQIPLSNGNGTNNTAGLTLYNHNDGTTGHDNYLDIASSVVQGTLPAPIEIRLTNTTGGSRWFYNWYIGNSLFGTSFNHIVEGETAVPGYGTVAASASLSNGNYCTLTGSGWLVFRWEIPAAQLDMIAGRYVRILVAFSSLSSSDRNAQVSLLDWSGLGTQAKAPAVTLKGGDTVLQDAGVIALPATPFGSNWSTHLLQLKVKTPSSETVSVDFLQITPAENTLYRRLQQRGYSMAVNEAVVDDGIEGLTYYDSLSDGKRYPIYVPFLQPVHVWPDVAQRLLVLFDGGSRSVDWTATAKVWYRPRRTLL